MPGTIYYLLNGVTDHCPSIMLKSCVTEIVIIIIVNRIHY